MVHIQTFGHIPSLLFYLGRYFFSTLKFFANLHRSPYAPATAFQVSMNKRVKGGRAPATLHPLLTPDTLQSLLQKLYNASPTRLVSFRRKL